MFRVWKNRDGEWHELFVVSGSSDPVLALLTTIQYMIRLMETLPICGPIEWYSTEYDYFKVERV